MQHMKYLLVYDPPCNKLHVINDNYNSRSTTIVFPDVN